MCLADEKTTTATTNVGTGSCPRIHPRPEYPPLWKVLWWDLHHSIEMGIIGSTLVHLLLPVYQWARDSAREQYEMTDTTFFALSVLMVHTGMYVSINLPYFLLDTFQIAQSYKLYRKPYMTPSTRQLIKLGIDQAIGQLVVAPIALRLFSPVIESVLLPLDAPMPSFRTTFLTFPVMSQVNGILFYFGHRLLHTKYLYKRVHKKHHEFFGSVGYAAEYAHPVESLLGNQVPIFAGVFLLMPCHPLLVLVWTMMGLQQTYEGHSGYCFVRLPRFLSRAVTTAHHDFHHTHNRGNFAGPIWMDWVFGTMDHYQSIGGYQGYLELKANNHNKSKKEAKGD